MITTLSDRSIACINQFIRENPDYVILGFGVISNRIFHRGIMHGKTLFVNFSESVLLGCKPFSERDWALNCTRPDLIYAYNPKVHAVPDSLQFNMTKELQDIINKTRCPLIARTIQL